MRFDDTLETVLAADSDGIAGARATWRQLVDLVGRNRVAPDARTMATLDGLRDRVPLAVRAASARALFGADPPVALVDVLVRDDIAVAAPLLRSVALDPVDWQRLLPILTPAGRAVLRHRRDLPAATVRALESFGPVDFVIAGLEDRAMGSDDVAADGTAAMTPGDAPRGPFVSVGQVAADIVDRALRRENDNETPTAPPIGPAGDGTFRIADVVARIEAFRRRREDGDPVPPPSEQRAVPDGFRFETDVDGVMRWASGAPREPLIGLSLAHPARPGAAGVDGAVAGAFRRRARFDAARLVVAGDSGSAGSWTIAGVPAFDAATGRFTGYRGTARRPHANERAVEVTAGGPAPDALRQLVHELRTPTNAIIGFSEMIEHQMLGPVAEPYRGQAASMRDDAHSLLAAIDDLDTAARLASGALTLRAETVAVDAVLTAIAADLQSLASDRGAVLSLNLERISADADTVALTRLLHRALSAMLGAARAGETLTVKLRPDDAATLRVTIDRPADLSAYPGDALLRADDENGPHALLGVGFALRLVRNLAAELGGGVRIGERRLTLRLPAAVDRSMERAQQN